MSLGPSPKSILQIINWITKLETVVLFVAKLATTVARAVEKEWVARYDVPEQLHSYPGV